MLLVKIIKHWIFYRGMFLLTCFMFLMSCNDNSNQIVNNNMASKHFSVDELVKVKYGVCKTSFIEDVIQVEGIVKEINYLNDRYTIILKGKDDVNSFVICDMQKSKLLKKSELGSEIKIKGILKGALKDIILLNCIIVN